MCGLQIKNRFWGQISQLHHFLVIHEDTTVLFEQESGVDDEII